MEKVNKSSSRSHVRSINSRRLVTSDRYLTLHSVFRTRILSWFNLGLDRVFFGILKAVILLKRYGLIEQATAAAPFTSITEPNYINQNKKDISNKYEALIA